VIQKPKAVGSEEYNAPELFDQNDKDKTYNGAKADVFSAAVTLFLMLTKCPPFRAAHLKDPFYRRLCSSDKKAFWKIFNGMEIDEKAKDLFERMTERDPTIRASIDDVLKHSWMKESTLDLEHLINEFDARNLIVEKINEA
jgi:serine/threonine protein kinase